MSATTIVDLGGSALHGPSISPAAGVGSTPASGVIIGMPVDLRDANNATNVILTFGGSISGQFRAQVQTSRTLNSGDFTDPTSGLIAFPKNVQSGGIITVNSGNGQASGGGFIAYFLRPEEARYARVNILSGDQFNAPVAAILLGQAKRTTSGPGYTMSPGSGGVGGF